MFPIPFNFPFIRKDGSRTTIGAAIGEGGGGDPYTLPTASATTKGGVKIGNGLEMDGEVLNVTGGGGGGVQFVDLHPKQSFGSGTRIDSVLLSDIISESDYNSNLANKTIYAVNVLDNQNTRLFGVCGNTYSNTIFTWFGTGSATLSTSNTLRIFYVDNPT